ncbi:MAG: hypothetical protein WEA61_10145 [Anaerolineales bacterium]
MLKTFAGEIMQGNKPYPPSWADRFLDWLDNLPIPYGITVLIIYGLAALSFHIALWVEGDIRFGAVDVPSLFDAIWSIVGVFFLLTLDRIAHRAMDKFSVLVPRKRRELELLRYKMTTLPPGPALAFTIVVIAILGAGAYLDPSFLGVSNPVSIAIYFFFLAFSYSFAPILLYHGLRQLSLVTQAYRLVDEINLFHLQPLYAFSGLTMTSSLFWIIILNFNLVSNYSGPAVSTIDLILSILFSFPYVVLAAATFIVPLWGIHRRIQNKKEAALEENGQQIEKTHRVLHRHLNKADYKKGGEMEKSLASLYKMREQIEKVPTWPWNPGTLRGFLSAVFLPLGVWVLQRFLSNLL